MDVLGRKITLHSFRHTYATLMAQVVGNNPFLLKEVLGHQRITTTEQYCHPEAPVIALPFDLDVQRGGRSGWAPTKSASAGEAQVV
jgi:integrase